MRIRNLLLLGLVLLGVIALFAVFALALQPPPPSAAVSTATPASDIVAQVDGESISRAEWQKAVAVDRAMSQLTGQVAPSAEVTLDRLINQRLVLRQVDQQQGQRLSINEAQVKERLGTLQKNWQADEAALERALTASNLSRQDLESEIKRLLAVEVFLKQQPNPNAWLAGQRARSQVGVLAELVAATPQPMPTVKPTSAATRAAALPTSTPSLAAPVGVAVGQLAPDFALDQLDGSRIKLSDWRGRVVVVNFWASWCPACRQELPALQTAYQQFKDMGVVLLGVDEKESAETIQAFAPQFNLTFPLLLDRDGAVAEKYQVRGIPTTVVVDAQGIVRARHIGPLTETKFSEYVTPLLSRPKSLGEPGVRTISEISPKLAPDFSLQRENGQTIRLSDYRDKSSVVLVFYRGQT